jgi:hypothetical protein
MKIHLQISKNLKNQELRESVLEELWERGARYLKGENLKVVWVGLGWVGLVWSG